MTRIRIFAGVSLITMSVLMLELGLTRIFSAIMYYHFAFMAISLGLFGSGASGVFIYVIQRRLTPARTDQWLSLASQFFAFTTVIALYVILTHPLVEATNFYATLMLIYTATAFPFFFAGCVVTLAITRFAGDINRLYLFDLAGAAIGCLLLIPVLNLVGAINTAFLVSASASVASLVFTSSTARRNYSIFSWCLAAGFVALLAYNAATHSLDIRISKGGAESDLLFAKWNSFSRITVRGNADEMIIQIDSDAATGIVKDASNVTAQQGALKNIPSLAYHLKRNADVLL